MAIAEVDKPSSSCAVTTIGSTLHEFMSCEEVANMFGLSPRTLERYRLEGTGPAYLKLGRRVVYSKAMVLSWANAQIRHSTSEAA